MMEIIDQIDAIDVIFNGVDLILQHIMIACSLAGRNISQRSSTVPAFVIINETISNQAIVLVRDMTLEKLNKLANNKNQINESNSMLITAPGLNLPEIRIANHPISQTEWASVRTLAPGLILMDINTIIKQHKGLPLATILSITGYGSSWVSNKLKTKKNRGNKEEFLSRFNPTQAFSSTILDEGYIGLLSINGSFNIRISPSDYANNKMNKTIPLAENESIMFPAYTFKNFHIELYNIGRNIGIRGDPCLVTFATGINQPNKKDQQ